MMPELPEVETIVSDLVAAAIPGRSVLRVSVSWPATIAIPPATEFTQRLAGKTIEAVQRRGKFILFLLSGHWALAVHLRMTGRFMISNGDLPASPHVHVVMALDDGRSLCFHDTRKFGRFYLTRDLAPLLGVLGPEPLSRAFTAQRLAAGLAGHKRQLKPLLLDQRFIAGLGNIYVDEALWAAKLHPLRRSDTLRPDEIIALHAAIRRVLRQGIASRGTTLGQGQGNFYSLGTSRGANEGKLQVFRRTGQPCRRCGWKVQRQIVGQRSTHLCEVCQRPDPTARTAARKRAGKADR